MERGAKVMGRIHLMVRTVISESQTGSSRGVCEARMERSSQPSSNGGTFAESARVLI
jgi:hypothetical protein